MTLLLNVILFFWLQQPAQAPRVIVGLVDGQQLVVDDPVFSGFIETRSGETNLKYRQENFHGNLPLSAVSRVDFEEYRKGGPFHLTISLRNGQKIQVQSEGQKFVMVKGRTDVGTVTIKNPDPLSSTVRITTKGQNRRKDLKITYLEFQ